MRSLGSHPRASPRRLLPLSTSGKKSSLSDLLSTRPSLTPACPVPQAQWDARTLFPKFHGCGWDLLLWFPISFVQKCVIDVFMMVAWVHRKSVGLWRRRQ